MLNKIKQDLALDLNCQSGEIHLERESKEKGNLVRWLRYLNQGYKVTTNPEDTAYLNIEPYDLLEPTTRAKPLYNDLDIFNLDYWENLRRSNNPEERERGERYFSDRGLIRPDREWIDNLRQENFHSPMVNAEGMENSTQSVIQALGLTGYREVQTLNYKNHTIRVLLSNNGPLKLTLQNEKEIKDITNFNTHNLNTNLKEILEQRANGQAENDLNIFFNFINNNEEEFVLAFLAQLAGESYRALTEESVREVEKLLSIENWESTYQEGEGYFIWPADLGEELGRRSFQILYQSMPGVQHAIWGFDFIFH